MTRRCDEITPGREDATVFRQALLLCVFASSCSILGCSRRAPSLRESSALASASAAIPAFAAPDASVVSGKAFGAACVGDSECAEGVCFHKRIKAPDAGKERRGANEAVQHDGYCSLRCTDDADCPVPPTKGRCGARGMCKKPD